MFWVLIIGASARNEYHSIIIFLLGNKKNSGTFWLKNASYLELFKKGHLYKLGNHLFIKTRAQLFKTSLA